MKVLRIAAREGALGVAQAHELMQAVRSYDSKIVPELVKIAAQQQAQSTDPYYAAMQQALTSGEVDLCVNNLEDLPLELSAATPIVAVSKRRKPLDALICRKRGSSPDLSKPLCARGKGRRAQLAKIYPGWEILPTVRNTEQMLQALEEGEFGAIAISASDADLLGLQSRVHLVFTPEQVLTSPGQGIIAVQGRVGENVSFLAGYHDVDAWDMALAERSFAKVLEGIEHPVYAVRSSVQGEGINVCGVLIDPKGKHWEGDISGSREDVVDLGAALAVQLKLDSTDPKQRKNFKFKIR